MTYRITVTEVARRPTVVVPATTTWQEFPALWMQLLDEVWACLRAGGIDHGCRNVMLYLDDTPQVEIGVQLDQPCPLIGRVVKSSLPAGRVAMTTHRGPYSELESAHRAVREWCATEGLLTVDTRWEIYGPHRDDPAELTTEIYWLLGQ